MTIRERIAELETEIGDLRHKMNIEKDSSIRVLLADLMDKLVARVQQLKREEAA